MTLRQPCLRVRSVGQSAVNSYDPAHESSDRDMAADAELNGVTMYLIKCYRQGLGLMPMTPLWSLELQA